MTIQRQPKGTFATFIRGLTDRAVPISFPFFVLENLPRATKEEIEVIRQQCRDAYAEPWQTKEHHSEPPDEDEPEPEEENEPEDPTEPSSEL